MSYNQGPAVPSVLLIDQSYSAIVPSVSDACIYFIQDAIGRGGARGNIGQGFANVMGQNGWNNPSFADLVCLAANGAIMEHQRTRNSMDNAIGVAAQSAVRMMTAAFTMNDPSIRNNMTAELQREAGGLIDCMNNMFAQINNSQQNVGYQQNGFSNWGGRQQSNNDWRNEPAPSWGGNQSQQGNQPYVSNGYGSQGRAFQAPQPVQARQTSSAPASGAYDYLEVAAAKATAGRQPVAAAPAPLPPHQPAQPAGPYTPSGPTGPAGPSAPGTPHQPYRAGTSPMYSYDFKPKGLAAGWKPSVAQLAPPLALNGTTVRVIGNDGNVTKYNLIPNDKDTQEIMDRTKHQPTLPNQVLSSIRPAFLHGSKTMQEVALNAVNTMASAVREYEAAGDNLAEEALKRFAEYGMTYDLEPSSSADKAIMTAKYVYMRDKSTREFYGICSISTSLVEYVVSKDDPQGLITQLAALTTFEDLSKAMRAILMRCDESESRISFVASIDRLLTTYINRVLGMNLMAKGVTMDSFLSDIPELQDYLLKRIGEAFANALATNEACILKEFWTYLTPAHLDTGEETLLTDPFVTEFTRQLDVFYLDVTSESLGLNTVAKEPTHLVDEAVAPLTNLAAAVLDGAGCGTNRQVILVTKDDVQYEFTKTLHRVQQDQRYFITRL